MIPIFLRKLLMTVVAVLTFGAVTPIAPPHYVTKPGDKGNVQSEKERSVGMKTSEPEGLTDTDQRDSEKTSSPSASTTSREMLIHSFAAYASKEAEDQGLHKFGPRVTARIGDRYTQEIVPAFIPLIQEISDGHDQNWIRQLAVTHSPASGMGERILHIYHKEKGKEVLKLHVRREHPPQQGYWFDFHYHTLADNFQQHHELKKVYWGKNTPPRWKA
ncbi:MAG: YpjP family protein [Sporolactobacillus sp.]